MQFLPVPATPPNPFNNLLNRMTNIIFLLPSIAAIIYGEYQVKKLRNGKATKP